MQIRIKVNTSYSQMKRKKLQLKAIKSENISVPNISTVLSPPRLFSYNQHNDIK